MSTEWINIDLEDIWLQQDDATPHSANDTTDILKTKIFWTNEFEKRRFQLAIKITLFDIVALFALGLCEKPGL